MRLQVLLVELVSAAVHAAISKARPRMVRLATTIGLLAGGALVCAFQAPEVAPEDFGLLRDAFDPQPLDPAATELLALAHQHYLTSSNETADDGDVDAAFLRLLKSHPTNPSVNSLASLRAITKGQVEEAVELAENALMGDTFDHMLRLALADYLSQASRFAVAIALVDGFVASGGSQQDAEAALLRILDRMATAAKAALMAGNTTVVARLLKTIAQRSPVMLFKPGGFADQVIDSCSSSYARVMSNLVASSKVLRSLNEQASSHQWAMRAEASFGSRSKAVKHAGQFLALTNDLSARCEAQQFLRDYRAAFSGYRELASRVSPRKFGVSAFNFVTAFKLEHDIAQIQYLIERKIIPPNERLDNMLVDYEEALEQLAAGCAEDRAKGVAHELPQSEADCDVFASMRHLTPALRARVASHLFTPLNQHPFADWSSDKPALNLGHFDWDDVQDRYLRGEVVVLDGFLTAEALEELYRIGLEATDWNDVKSGGYLGAMYNKDGFAPPVIAQLANDLEAAMPRVFDAHSLLMFWGFKHDTVLARTYRGILAHADTAAVNLNFWVTPDEYNLDPESGGLIVYNVSLGAEDTDFNSYNSNARGPKEFGLAEKDILKRVPYRQNRVVMFTSSYLHATDRVEFKKSYESCRINYTLLFGYVDSIRCKKTESMTPGMGEMVRGVQIGQVESVAVNSDGKAMSG